MKHLKLNKFHFFPQRTLKNPVVNVGCWHVQCERCWLTSLVSFHYNFLTKINVSQIAIGVVHKLRHGLRGIWGKKFSIISARALIKKCDSGRGESKNC
jgi:hypothetical protein